MQKNITLALAILMPAILSSGTARSAILAQSNFDSSPEGWNLCPGGGPFCDFSNPVTYFATGGDPGGMIAMEDPRNVSWFIAPVSVRTSLSEIYGGTLSYSLSQVSGVTPFLDTNVVIVNPSNHSDFLAKHTLAPFRTSTIMPDYTVTLNETATWYSYLSSGAATAADFARVLATDPFLYIKGHQFAGPLTSFLDGVVLRSAVDAPPPPPPFTINDIIIKSDGSITGDFNRNLPTVVVTHGWQPEVLNPLSQSFCPYSRTSDGCSEELVIRPLFDVSNAVAARAATDEQSLNLITYQWEGAYTKDYEGINYDGIIRDYNEAAINTTEAGTILGNILDRLFDDNAYTGNLHMIGHSLGTVVNAEAVNRFEEADIVDQFTILDAPSDPPFDSARHYGSFYFNERLPAELVTYVDNFYGDRTFYGNGVSAVGVPIDNAARNGGTALSGLGHTEVHEQFYSPHIGETGWVTPIFGLDETIFYARPGPRIWEPQVTTISAPESAPLNDFPVWGINFGTTEIQTLDIGGTAGTTVMVLIPQSPVSISQHFDIPDGATLLTFDFGFLDPGTGEFLQLYFGDILLWEMPWMNDLVGELLNAVVPIESLAGLSGDLTFLLDSTNGNAQARAFLTNFEVMGQFVETASVPEPGTMLLLGTGLLALARLRYAMAWQAGMRRKLAA